MQHSPANQSTKEWAQHQARHWCYAFLAGSIGLAFAILAARGCGGDGIPVYAQSDVVSAIQQTLAQVHVEAHYSPAEDLEAIDLLTLDQAQKRLDISAYAMDDAAIAHELVTLAQRGVAIRIYRDQQQHDGETARGRKGSVDLNKLFAGQPNIHIKVKGVMALAHLKAYAVDGVLLREGSANWSVQGEKVQDNSLILISDSAAVARFETDFEAIWNRTSNQDVQ